MTMAPIEVIDRPPKEAVQLASVAKRQLGDVARYAALCSLAAGLCRPTFGEVVMFS